MCGTDDPEPVFEEPEPPRRPGLPPLCPFCKDDVTEPLGYRHWECMACGREWTE